MEEILNQLYSEIKEMEEILNQLHSEIKEKDEKLSLFFELLGCFEAYIKSYYNKDLKATSVIECLAERLKVFDKIYSKRFYEKEV